MRRRLQDSGASRRALGIAVPITLYVATLVCYVWYQSHGGADWFRAGFMLNVLGAAMALVVALPLFLQWLIAAPDAATNGRPARTGLILNVAAVGTMAADAWIYDGNWALPPSDVVVGSVLAAAALGCALAAIWGGRSSRRDGYAEGERGALLEPVSLPDERQRRVGRRRPERQAA